MTLYHKPPKSSIAPIPSPKSTTPVGSRIVIPPIEKAPSSCLGPGSYLASQRPVVQPHAERKERSDQSILCRLQPLLRRGFLEIRIRFAAFWFFVSLCQLLAQPIAKFIKRLKLARSSAADLFGRAAPGAIVDRAAIRPQADDECGFTNWGLHDLEFGSFLA